MSIYYQLSFQKQNCIKDGALRYPGIWLYEQPSMTNDIQWLMVIQWPFQRKDLLIVPLKKSAIVAQKLCGMPYEKRLPMKISYQTQSKTFKKSKDMPSASSWFLMALHQRWMTYAFPGNSSVDLDREVIYNQLRYFLS